MHTSYPAAAPWAVQQFKPPMHKPIEPTTTHRLPSVNQMRRRDIAKATQPAQRNCLNCGNGCAVIDDERPYSGVVLCWASCNARNVFRNSVEPIEIMPPELDTYYLEVVRYDSKTVADFLDLFYRIAGDLANFSLRSLLTESREFRFPNVIDVVNEARTVMGDVTPVRVHPRLFRTMFEAIAVENDLTLRKRWAALLANSANPDFAGTVLPSFVDVMWQLTPEHFFALEYSEKAEANASVLSLDLARLGLLAKSAYTRAFLRACSAK